MNGKVLERYAELMIDKIRQMSAGEWQKPWFTPRTGLPQNISGRPYNSMNRLMLYIEMDRMGYTLPVFMTFRQLKDENLMIIKGSHALPVTFYDITVKHKTTGEKISFDDYKSLPELQKQEYKVTPFMKHFYVFNIDQTDFKEQYPDAMALIRVGDEYKAYNQDAERLHEVLGVCARKAVSGKDGTPVMTASFRHVDLDTHLRSIIKAGSKVTINHYEKAAAPDKSMTTPLLFKGGRREIEITSAGAVIRTNGNQYDATGILKGLEKAGIDVRNISGSQWESMLRGRGTVLNPAKQKMLFSIRKQPSGYGVRIADISGKISSSVQREL